MDTFDQSPTDQLEVLSKAFSNQLLACLEECAHGRRGLFSDVALTEEDQSNREWPEAARLRELAQALQNVFAQYEQRNALCDEFLDLCSNAWRKPSRRTAPGSYVSSAHRTWGSRHSD